MTLPTMGIERTWTLRRGALLLIVFTRLAWLARLEHNYALSADVLVARQCPRSTPDQMHAFMHLGALGGSVCVKRKVVICTSYTKLLPIYQLLTCCSQSYYTDEMPTAYTQLRHTRNSRKIGSIPADFGRFHNFVRGKVLPFSAFSTAPRIGIGEFGPWSSRT